MRAGGTTLPPPSRLPRLEDAAPLLETVVNCIRTRQSRSSSHGRRKIGTKDDVLTRLWATFAARGSDKMRSREEIHFVATANPSQSIKMRVSLVCQHRRDEERNVDEGCQKTAAWPEARVDGCTFPRVGGRAACRRHGSTLSSSRLRLFLCPAALTLLQRRASVILGNPNIFSKCPLARLFRNHS